MPTSIPLSEMLQWIRRDEASGCWTWTGPDPEGLTAAQLVWEVVLRERAPRRTVTTCGTAGCVNPAHRQLVPANAQPMPGLAERRAELMVTQDELARWASVSRRTVQRIEKGSAATAPIRRRLEEALAAVQGRRKKDGVHREPNRPAARD